MAAVLKGDPVYIMGRTARESRRLTVQAHAYEPATRRILERAGIQPGMRVLDIGSGAGDVAMLAAGMVGPTGAVVGIDRNATILELARKRVTQAGLDNVEFFASDMRDLPPLGPFDAVIGRLTLMYVADPVEAVRALLHHLKPGGVVAFAEFNLVGDSFATWPSLPIWGRMWNIFKRLPEGTGIELAMGWKLRATLAAAGLTDVRLSLESPLMPASNGMPAFILAEVIRSVLPLVVRCGIATEDEVDIDTLEERLQAEAVPAGAIIKLPELVGAWARAV